MNNLVDSLINGTTALANGELVCVSSGGSARRAQADTTSHLTGFFGAVQTAQPIANGGRTPIVLAGVGSVLLETGLTPAAGDTIFVSTTVAGRGTTVEPPLRALAIGVVMDADLYPTRAIVTALIGGPTLAIDDNTIASWSVDGARFYAVDPVDGDDTALGYSDVSLSAAGAVALKTLEELYNRLPKNGANRTCIVGLGAGTYIKKDNVTPAELILRGLSGYKILTFRATAFLDTVQDKYDLAGVTQIAGPNLDGSWTVQSVSGTTVTIASGTLPVNRTANGWKIRWKGNVTTGATITPCGLRNVVTTATFELAATTTVATGDDFWIEAPSVIIDGIDGHVDMPRATLGSLRAMCFAGIKFNNSTLLVALGDAVNFAFCELPGNTVMRQARQIQISGSYVDETGTLITLRHAFRAGPSAGFSIVGGTGTSILRCAFILGTLANTPHKFFSVGDLGSMFGGSYIYGSLHISGGGYMGTPSGNTAEIGKGSSSTTLNELCIEGNLYIRGVNARVDGVDITGNSDGSGALKIGGACNVTVANVSGSTGNAGGGVTVDGPGARVVFEPTNTISGATGEILGTGGLVLTHAQVAAENYCDTKGNVFQGNTGYVVTRKTAGTLYNGPVLGADPPSPVDGDSWVTNISGTRQICVRIGGTTYRTTLT